MKGKLIGILMLFIALIMHTSYAQQTTISGTVTDDTGLPLPGVNVVVKNTSNGTQTDFNGLYSIIADQGSILMFSYIGFANQSITVGNDSIIDISLLPSAAELDEVIVTAYGTTKRSTTTSSISTVSSEAIENFVPTTSIDNILQGQAAGVRVTAANGRPGNTGFVQIRGIGSLSASTTPLYIIDGVPIPIDENENFNPLNNISPNDIASVSILKDAASASKYGSRGSNGVVLITTKKGKSGEAQITFTSSYGFGRRIEDPFNLMNAEQKLEIERQYASLGVNAANGLPGATSTPAEIASLVRLNTDWEKELLRVSEIQSNVLSISGGSEKLSYFFSVGHNMDSGIIDRIKGFERISSRLNTTYQAKDWLNIGVNVSASRSTTDLPRDRNNVQNPFRAMYDYNPYAPLYERDNSGNINLDEQGEQIFNTSSNVGFPIAKAINTEPENRSDLLFIAGTFANIKLSENFSNRFSLGLINNRFNRTIRSLPGGVLQGFIGDAQFPGTQTENVNVNFEYNVNNLFTYSNTINEVHNISVSGLLEYNESIRNELFITARGFPSPDIPYLDVAAESTNSGSNEARRLLFSQALFADYNYAEKYIISASIRRDASSGFGPNNKYATFPSGSLAWNISKEEFMSNSFFNNLKIRASYGKTGNQSIPDFEYIDAAGFSTYNGNTTVIPLRVGNPDVKWEAQAILNIGVEFGFWNNRISGTFDYFNKTSKDLLLNRPLSHTVGDENNSLLFNIGEVRNEGLELSLNADIIRTQVFNFSIGGNITFLDYEVLDLVDGNDITTGNSGNVILREGEEIYSYYMVEYAGVNPENGAPQYFDLDGNISETYSDSFQQIQKDKSPLPNMQGGFYSSFKYKGFGLRGDFVFTAGNYILNRQRAEGESIGNVNGNLRTTAFNYWKEEGDINVLPSPIFQDNADQTFTTRFLEKGDYIRLRTLTLDYQLPSKFTDVLPIDRMRIFATGQNILTFTDYQGDPEIGVGSTDDIGPGDAGFVPGEFSLFSYPQIKSYIFGIEVTF